MYLRHYSWNNRYYFCDQYNIIVNICILNNIIGNSNDVKIN